MTTKVRWIVFYKYHGEECSMEFSHPKSAKLFAKKVQGTVEINFQTTPKENHEPCNYLSTAPSSPF